MSRMLNVSKNTVVSIGKLIKYGTTPTLPRAGPLTKLMKKSRGMKSQYFLKAQPIWPSLSAEQNQGQKGTSESEANINPYFAFMLPLWLKEQFAWWCYSRCEIDSAFFFYSTKGTLLSHSFERNNYTYMYRPQRNDSHSTMRYIL